jgi:Flp pilus assembly protein TadD
MQYRASRILSRAAWILIVSAYAFPQTAIDHFRHGRALGEAGHMEGAASEFREAIRLEPDYAEAHYFLALSLIAAPTERLDWLHAADECRLAVANRPNYPEALHLLGVALAAMNRQSEAIEQFRKALQLRPDYPEAHLDLGMAYASDSQNELAAAEYLKALAERPNYAVAHQRLGKLLLAEGKLDEAQSEVIAALKINPDDADSHYVLARVLVAKHSQQAAQVEFRQVEQLHARQSSAIESVRLSNSGLDAARRGYMEQAVQDLRKAVAEKPDSAVAHYNLGLVLADCGHLDEAIAEVSEGISLAPLETGMQKSLDRMLQKAGRTQAAPNSEPDNSERHSKRGLQLAAQGNQQAAIAEDLRALTLKPDNVDARAALAAAYRAAGEDSDAELETAKLNLIRSGKVGP